MITSPMIEFVCSLVFAAAMGYFNREVRGSVAKTVTWILFWVGLILSAYFFLKVIGVIN